MSTIDLKRFHAAFFAESFEGLDGLEADLLRLEQGERDPELLNAIFRAIHSIKGSGGSLGFDAIAEFSHHLETLLDQVRKGRYQPNSEMVNLLLASIDCLRAMLSAGQVETEPDLERARALQEQLAHWQHRFAPAAPVMAAPELRADTAQPAAPARYRISFRPHAGFFNTGNDPLRLFRSLDVLGEFEAHALADTIPDIANFDPEQCYLAWDITLTTAAGRDAITEVFDWVSESCDLSIETAPDAAPALADKATLSRRRTDSQPGEQTDRRRQPRRQEDREPGEARVASLHVNTEKMDELVNLVGELVITHTMLKQLTSNFEMDRVLQLESAVTQLERNTRDLQQRVMAIRMQPVSFVFGRFGRLVRDVSQQLGKQVELRITGEQSELDKTVIEKLTDPLTHLVRNALDHGIEPPQERRLSGKPETAVLALHAEHKSGNIMIEVRDDGRGIDLQKVHDKAVQQGLIGAHEELDEAQLQKLIFLPGFSTAQSISDLSGRGVGLDVVRSNIDELGGTLEVSSQRGVGTAFIIRLPLTLAILDGMSVSVGDQVYIVPMIFIVECLQPAVGAIKTVAGRGCVVEVRGTYVPIVELHKLCGIASTLKAEQGILLLIEADGNKVALLVDALLGQDQVVVKSLDANYRKVQYITGATILGNGRVALILDVAAVVRVAT